MNHISRKFLLYTNTKTFRISKHLGLFAVRAKARSTFVANLMTKSILVALLIFNLYMGIKSVLTTKFAVIALVWQAYAILSLLSTLVVYHCHFKLFSNSKVIFRSVRNKRIHSNLVPSLCVYSVIVAVEFLALFSIMYYTRRDNIISYVTFTSYIVVALMEYGFYLMVSQMYLIGCTIATYIDKITRRISHNRRTIHDNCIRMMDVVDMSFSLNQCYQQQIFFGYLYLFMKLINCGYYTAIYIFVRSQLIFMSRYWMANFILNIAVVCGSFFPIVLPIAACEQINNAVRKLNEMTSKI